MISSNGESRRQIAGGRARNLAGGYAVAYTILANMLIMGATTSSFGLFVVPVSADLHLSRADMNMALIVLNISTAILAPLIGWVLDRVAARTVILVGAFCFGAGLVGLGLTHGLIACLGLIVLPLAIGVASLAATAALIVRHFAARRSGALLVGAMGLSLGALLTAPVVAWLIQYHGWRNALVLAGAGIGVLLVAAALPLREPQWRRVTTSGSADQLETGQPAPVMAFLGSLQFWLLALGIALPMAVAQSLTISLVPIVVDTGSTLVAAASIILIAGMTSLIAKLLLAMIADRVDRYLLLTFIILLGAAANLALLAHSGRATLLFAAAAIGVSNGALNPMFSAVVADRYGRPSFGTAHGLIFPVIFLCCALYARIAGDIFDRMHSYHGAFLLFVATEALAMLLILLVRRSGRGSPNARGFPA